MAQFVHASLPASPWYVPTAHLAQAVPAAEYWPAMQSTQPATAVAAAALPLPPAHATHAFFPVSCW